MTQTQVFSSAHFTNFRFQGVITALVIILLWAYTLTVSFTLVSPSFTELLEVVVLFSIQTYLFTGLFITAHDSMHGLVAPPNKKLNKFIGSLCLIFYALFSFKKLKQEHEHHHNHSGSDSDPDFYKDGSGAFFYWYIHFLLHYISLTQLISMALLANFFIYVLHIPQINVYLLWALPAATSTLQLFYFGTYLPHRKTDVPFQDSNNAASLHYSRMLSLLACYHFGCHLTHHRYPYIPWWKLYDGHLQDQVTL
jgi:beta-carotene/zeaxanthin 4-ketolase